ncbi:MAG TPA: ATP-binding protein [Phycisphaerae bacterium]|nr:ATP-binding protein [Phycisphaerae bacterium]
MESTSNKAGPRTAPPQRSEPPTVQHSIERQINALEQHFDALQRQVQQLQRMASIGTVSAMLAHEINNLLTPVLTYTQYALQREDPNLWKSAAERSNKNAARLSNLCQRMLGFATHSRSEARMILVKPLLLEAVECLGHDLHKDQIQVSIVAPADLSVFADPAALQQVLFNLVLNAWQAMFSNPGRLTLSAAPIDADQAVITVQDTGCGIGAENMQRIFEPFFSTKSDQSESSRRGTGLGLHVCRQLVEELGGRIEVQSEMGIGTTLSITIPRCAGN